MLLILSLCSCQKRSFTIEGSISGAADSVLHLEQMGLDGIHHIEETVLGEDGQFRFTAPSAGTPEFYRLRIGGETIALSIDSTETVRITATYPGMASAYQVEGSEGCLKIKELSLLQQQIEKQANAVLHLPSIGIIAAEDSIDVLVKEYKQKVSREYIFREPMKAYAYFALFQTLRIGDATLTVFNPRRDATDAKVFGAVATSWDALYPQSLRAENLHNIAIEGMKDANVQKRRSKEIAIDAQAVGEASLIDLALTDNKGTERRLSQLKGKVVLLDFHLFNVSTSAKRIMQLRELYNKYHPSGLEIYQVSLDEDLHFWKTQTAALPWISVHDDGSRAQAYLTTVEKLPADFIIARDNSIVRGPGQIKNLEEEIAAAMHK